MRTTLARLVLSVAVLFLVPQARALAGPATDEVKATVDRIVEILRAPSLQGPAHERERRALIREAVLRRFGFDEMAARSLGPTWQTLDPAQRKEFVGLFTELLERSYISRVETYHGEQITYTGESVDGDHAEVDSTIGGARGREPTAIVYRLIQTGSGWQVYDLVIDGVSLVNNYRQQFAQITRNASYDELVAKMKRKLEAEDEGGG